MTPRWLKTFIKKENFNTLRRKMSQRIRTKTKLKKTKLNEKTWIHFNALKF